MSLVLGEGDGDPAAAWFPDPTGGHRLRYWNGSAWSAWVADDGGAFMEQSPARLVDGLAAPRISDGAQRFAAQTTIVGAPIWVAVFAFLGLITMSHGYLLPGLGGLAIAVVSGVSCLSVPYVAVVRLDGSLTFKAAGRSITTTTDAVYRIRVRRGGKSKATVFYFDGGSAALGELGGTELARWLRVVNPSIEGDRP